MTSKKTKVVEETLVEEKSEERVLFPEAVVGKYTIKPWSFGKLFEISGYLSNVLDKIDEKGIADKLEEGFITYLTMVRLFSVASSEMLFIMSTTMDIEIDEIKEFSMEEGVKIALIIYDQNKETIKNALKPLLPNL